MSVTGRTVLVTGATGYVGGHVCKALVGAGANVVGFARRTGPATVRGDITDYDALVRACAGVELIIHLAVSPGYVAVEQPALDGQVNAIGTLNVLRAAEATGIRKVVLGSSSHVYGRGGSKPVRETSDARPINFYGASKRAGEIYAEVFARSRGISTVILRFTMLYGSAVDGSTPLNLVARMTRAALRSEQLALRGRPSLRLDLLNVEDAASAVMLSLGRATAPGRVFNIGSGRSITLGRLARALITEAGSSSSVQIEPTAGESGVLPLLDIGRATRELRYRPRVPLADGLRAFVAAERLRAAAI